jgi:hypothetical protein
MKPMLILLAGAVTLSGLAHAQDFPQAPTDLPHLIGADLFIDLARYAGKQVVITDGYVHGVDNNGALLKAGAVTFRVQTEGIDRETFRYLLKNCDGSAEMPECRVRLLVTPTGKSTLNWPNLAGVQIVR